MDKKIKDLREALALDTYNIIKATGQDMSNYRVKGVKANMLYTEYLVKDYKVGSKKQQIQSAIRDLIKLNSDSNTIEFTKKDGSKALIRINGANVK
tara:strand:- start:4558 stop:4845 length:288 start_codon:yes stop_codon:yes gene_type:complete